MADTIEFYAHRFALKDKYTISHLYADGRYVCDIIEDKDYGFDGTTPTSLIRQTKKEHPKQVAIPLGRYLVDVQWKRGFADKHPWYKSQPLGARIPCLTGVPAYSGILIHCGVNQNSSAGCLIVGYNKVKGGVINSKEAYTKVASLMQEANAQGKKIYITISHERPEYAI